MSYRRRHFLPKNERNNSSLLLVDLFSFVFWEKVKAPIRHFEKIWPLVLEYLPWSLYNHNACIKRVLSSLLSNTLFITQQECSKIRFLHIKFFKKIKNKMVNHKRPTLFVKAEKLLRSLGHLKKVQIMKNCY